MKIPATLNGSSLRVMLTGILMLIVRGMREIGTPGTVIGPTPPSAFRLNGIPGIVISGTTIGPTPPSAFRLNGIPGIVISGTTIGPTPPSAFRL
ncbi:hypothetical protein, partial [Mycobacterium canetti]|uniref:hypothetical protein n=1 Tax=Mycobacterium canetti TaxID=78331 RepID=UPI001EE3ABE1